MSATEYEAKAQTGAIPTRTRYKVVGFCVALAGVTYLDRNAISILAPQIQEDLGLSRIQMGWVFTAFALSYMAFEIPTGWWGQKIGTRRVLTRIVTWWSFFTMATAAAFSYPSMLVTRFLFGIGEAGAWPNAARTFSLWIPGKERGRVQGVFFFGAFLIGGLTPILVGFLEPYVGWRGVFLVLGPVGFIWAAAWYRWYRDDPTEHPGVNEAEANFILANRVVRDAHHHPGALARLAKNASAWALCLGYFSNSYGSYFVMTWLPTYLSEQRGFERTELTIFSGLPLILSAGAALAGGVITDSLTKRFGVQIGRTAIGAVGYTVAAGAMVFAANLQDARTAAFVLALAFAASMIPIASHWACVIEIGKENAGVLGGTMNTVGQIGSLTSPLIAAFLVDHYSNWALPLYVMAGLYVFTAITWLVMRLKPEEATARQPGT